MQKYFTSMFTDKKGYGLSQYNVEVSLLEMITLLAVQSFAWILIHNAILFINTSPMLGTIKFIG